MGKEGSFEMAKALVFSDLHLHSHKGRVDRLQDCLNALEWVFKTAISEKCDHIFFLGDLFHERFKIDAKNYLLTFEMFMKYMMDQSSNHDMYLLVGNHDMYHRTDRWDINSVKPLSAIPRVTIIQGPSSLEIGGRKIDWLPHTENPIKALDEFKENGVGDILFAHISVHGAKLNTLYGVRSDVFTEYDNEMVPVDVSLFNDWQMTMLGLYHGEQKLSDKVEYVGSPLHLSYGEAFQQKHIIVLDLETLEKKYIVNDFSPKHYIISERDALNDAYDLKSSFARITIDNIGKKELLDLQAKILATSPLSLDFKQADKKPEEHDATVIEDAKSILTDTKQMLEKYMKDRGVPEGLDEKKLLTAGEKCLEKIT